MNSTEAKSASPAPAEEWVVYRVEEFGQEPTFVAIPMWLLDEHGLAIAKLHIEKDGLTREEAMALCDVINAGREGK